MDDEATKLLRELRDIALRGEARTVALVARQKRVMIVCFVVLAIALAALAYSLSFLREREAEQRDEHQRQARPARLLSQPSRPESRRPARINLTQCPRPVPR
jgi:hypothetical protein